MIEFILTHSAWYLLSIMGTVSIICWSITFLFCFNLARLFYTGSKPERRKGFYFLFYGAGIGFAMFILISFFLPWDMDPTLPPTIEMLKIAKISLTFSASVFLLSGITDLCTWIERTRTNTWKGWK